jgi:hypothetical protein
VRSDLALRGVPGVYVNLFGKHWLSCSLYLTNKCHQPYAGPLIVPTDSPVHVRSQGHTSLEHRLCADYNAIDALFGRLGAKRKEGATGLLTQGILCRAALIRTGDHRSVDTFPVIRFNTFLDD